MPSRAPMRGNNAAALNSGGETPYIRVGRQTRAQREAEVMESQMFRDTLWEGSGHDEGVYYGAIHRLQLRAIFARKRREGIYTDTDARMEPILMLRYMKPEIDRALKFLAFHVGVDLESSG